MPETNYDRMGEVPWRVVLRIGGWRIVSKASEVGNWDHEMVVFWVIGVGNKSKACHQNQI